MFFKCCFSCITPLGYDVIKQEFPDKFVPAALGFVSAMFSIGASIGLLGGAALIDALDNQYNDIFWIVAPIATLSCASFFITMAHITPSCIIHKIKHRGEKSPDPANKRSMHEILVKVLHLDFGGAFLVSTGAILLLIGLNEVIFWKFIFFWYNL